MRSFTIVLVGLLLLTVVGCSGASKASASTENVTATMTEFKFTPNVINAHVGQTVKVTLQNKGTVVHDFNIDELNVHSQKVSPGQNGTVTFTPTKAGTYQFYCSEPGHKEAGMVGQLKVS